MKKYGNKIMLVAFVFYIFVILHTKVYGASMVMSISKTSAYVGETFTVTISGVNGKVNISGNSNISLDKTGSQWVDGSLTITVVAKAVGNGQITVIPVDVTTDSADPQEVTAPASRSITIKEKEPIKPSEPETPKPAEPEVPKPSQPETPNPAEPETPKPSQPETQTPNKPSSPNQTTSTTNESNNIIKEEEPDKNPEDNNKTNFMILKLNLIGIKENGEKVDITISPEFKSDIYEYTCDIPSDIKTVELEKDAGEYSNHIVVTGLDELKEGENVITIQLVLENTETKAYVVKAIKEKKQDLETNVEKIENEEVRRVRICMPLWMFILIQIIIIILEVLLIYFIMKRKLFKKEEKVVEEKEE